MKFHLIAVLIFAQIISIEIIGQSNDENVVSLSKYNIPLKLEQLDGAKLDYNEYSTTIVLSETLSVRLDTYSKSEWNLDNGYEYNSIKDLMTEHKTKKESEIDKIIEEQENMIVAKLQGSWSFIRPNWVTYYIESDEAIYHFYSYPQNAEEIEVIKKTLKTIEYLAPCSVPALKINEHDVVIDLSEYNYPFKFSFPSNIKTEKKKTSWGASVKPEGMNYSINIDQYIFGNDLEQSIIDKKNDRKKNADFLAILKDEAQGYVMEKKDLYVGYVYDVYYFHLSDEKYYKIDCYYRTNSDSNATREEQRSEALELYERFKGASVSQLCE